MTADRSADLQLNQSSLQDFLDCPRRFELNHLDQTRWPAAHSNPPSSFEDQIELGNRFHLLCNQYFLGIDQDHIIKLINDPVLKELWDKFLPYGSELKELHHYSEQILRLSFHGHTLIAKFDYIAVLPDDTYLIIDWKTSTYKPDRTALSRRIQTLLYPFIFFQTGHELFQAPKLQPGQISLQYWYPRSSDPGETFHYSPEHHNQNKVRFRQIISDLESLIETDTPFPLTSDLSNCKYCTYRSFCDRGTVTPQLETLPDYESEDLSNTQFDLNLIEEIEY